MIARLTTRPLAWGWAFLLVSIGAALTWIGLGRSSPQPVGSLVYEGTSLAGVVLRDDATLSVTLSHPATLRLYGLQWEGGGVNFSMDGYLVVMVGDETVFPFQRWPHLQPNQNRVWLSIGANTLTIRINDEWVWSGPAGQLPLRGFNTEGRIQSVQLWR